MQGGGGGKGPQGLRVRERASPCSLKGQCEGYCAKGSELEASWGLGRGAEAGAGYRVGVSGRGLAR